MDYCLGAGDGVAAIWSGQPDADIDGDGELDGVRMDFDGDGRFDDALIDLDGDGLADHAALDFDDDGHAESLYVDDGSGTWALTSGAGNSPLRWLGVDGAEHTASELPASEQSMSGSVDFDGDGRPDRLLDVDRNGLADRALLAGDDGRFVAGYFDTDGDGRWDVKLVDADSDGAADQGSAL